MNLFLTWNSEEFGFRPVAAILPAGDERLLPVESILNDDGGLETDHSIFWIDVGLERLQAVAVERADLAHWARESWAIECHRSRTRVYFMVDEDYWVDVAPQVFTSLLTAWRNFLKDGPVDASGAVNSMSIPIGEKDDFLIESSV